MALPLEHRPDAKQHEYILVSNTRSCHFFIVDLC
jgi:hypothetical protein